MFPDFLVFLSAAAVSGLFWVFFVEPRSYQRRNFKISLPVPLKRSYRVLHLSDIHFSRRNAGLTAFFDRLSREIYDFIFLTGDIFDSIEGIPSAVENLKKLKHKHGFFAVFGNHDYHDYHLEDIFSLATGRHPETLQPVDKFRTALHEAGVRLLSNESSRVWTEEDIFMIHGVDDPTTGRADIPAILQNTDPSALNVLLTHSIDSLLQIPENRMNLSFSGHSHGGQIRLPFVGAIVTHTRLGRRYAQGLHEFKGAKCVVSKGMGSSRFLRLRFLCLPEAVTLDISGA